MRKNQSPSLQAETVLRLPQVVALTGLSKSTIRRMEERGEFPQRRQISVRAVGWHSSAVAAFIKSRTAAAGHRQ